MQVKTFSHSIAKGFKNLEEAKALDSPSTLLLAFCSPAYFENSNIFEDIKKQFPKSSIAGCSTSGEIHGTELRDLSVSFAAIKFVDSSFKIEYAKISGSADSKNIGVRLGSALKGESLSACIILSDGLNANGSALVAGFGEVIDTKKVPVSGGLAGDGNAFESTWVLVDGKPTANYICAIGIYGAKLKISCSSRGGWDKFGPERRITKSNGNTLYEIDGEPALALYKRYLGEKSNELPASGLLFPLQIRSSNEDKRPLVRTLLAVNEEESSLIFAGDVPENSLAQLMKANFDRVIEASGDAAEICSNATSEKSTPANSITIAVSCVGRRLVLGERSEEELDVIGETLGLRSSVLGFYSYGEICSHDQGTGCELHNQSMTLMTIFEDVG